MPTNIAPSADWIDSMRQAAGPDAAPRQPVSAYVPWQTAETPEGLVEWQILDGGSARRGRRLLVVEYPSGAAERIERALRALAE